MRCGRSTKLCFPHVASRYDLTYILGEMIGELSNSHTYVNGPADTGLHPVAEGLLGADYELDAATGYYRFKKIYPGENWDAQSRSPLTEPGLNVKAGDYLLAVNGRPLKAPHSPDELLANTADQTTAITVNATPSLDGARTIAVKPLADENQLRMNDMIETNRKKVDAATKGRVGYVYIPDMEDDGLNEFVKQYFPQIHKEGMIIDVRYNGGGFVDRSHLRAPASRACRHGLGTQLGSQQRQHVPALGLQRLYGRHHQSIRGVGRRHLQLLFQGL